MEIAGAVRAALPASEAAGQESPTSPVVVVAAESVTEVLRYLRDDPGHRYTMLTDITAVDRVAIDATFEVVYVLRSLQHGRLLVVKTSVSAEDPVLASATPLWPAANWPEREVWDMFGVRFEGHPDLRRILMYEEFEGHPLRKAYPFDRRQPLVEERDVINDPWPSRDGL